MSKRTLQEILTDAGHEPSAYSGRGMCGETCLSVTADNLGALFADVLEILDAEENEIAAHAFRGMRTDSLGRSTVVYFPRVAFVE
mgnify:CR=1 FL=1